MKTIFVDIDVQRDFCDPEGALHVPGSPNDTFEKAFEEMKRAGVAMSTTKERFE